MDIGTSLLELMYQGGWVMWGLLAFSIAAMAVAVERAVALHKAKTDLAPLIAKLRNALLRKGSTERALEVLSATPGVVARVAEAGLHRFDRPASHLERPLERRALAEIQRLNRGLGILATTATVAPLLGFLGTVTGMMSSFYALSRYGLSDPGMVALGIMEALTTTAAGLTVAVPAQLAYNFLSARVDKITHDIEAVANFLLEVREEMDLARA